MLRIWALGFMSFKLYKLKEQTEHRFPCGTMKMLLYASIFFVFFLVLCLAIWANHPLGILQFWKPHGDAATCGRRVELLATNVSRIWRNVFILNMWKISRACRRCRRPGNGNRQSQQWKWRWRCLTIQPSASEESSDKRRETTTTTTFPLSAVPVNLPLSLWMWLCLGTARRRLL